MAAAGYARVHAQVQVASGALRFSGSNNAAHSTQNTFRDIDLHQFCQVYCFVGINFWLFLWPHLYEYIRSPYVL